MHDEGRFEQGTGFATAVQIAQKLGIYRDLLNRARAGLVHFLLEDLRWALRLTAGQIGKRSGPP